jgi:hypothetical protein
VLVQAREAADFLEGGMEAEEHSEPQLFQGKAIAAQLKAWRAQPRMRAPAFLYNSRHHAKILPHFAAVRASAPDVLGRGERVPARGRQGGAAPGPPQPPAQGRCGQKPAADKADKQAKGQPHSDCNVCHGIGHAWLPAGSSLPVGDTASVNADTSPSFTLPTSRTCPSVPTGRRPSRPTGRFHH